MSFGLNASFEQFIKWQKSYKTYAYLINKQHRKILNFINSWYHKLKEGQEAGNLY